MGQAYNHLTLEDRCSIARLHEGGQSIRQIAAALDRAPSTISRELSRNRGSRVGYRPVYAEEQARARRWTGSRLERDDALRGIVLGCLERGWSPEQIAGWMREEKTKTRISHESIYRFIYAQLRRTNEGAWRRYLPRAKSKRGKRSTQGRSPASFIQDRVEIAARPTYVASRRYGGHWEVDLMQFRAYGQALLVAHERKSRVVLLAKQPSKAADPTVRQLVAWFEPLGRRVCRTITFDNGTEFAQHYRLNRQLGIKTYFCQPHSPWQKGGIENAIGRLRRPLPRKTDLARLERDDLDDCVAAYNNTPRKCLGFKTPAQVFRKKVLHFECESTCRFSPA